MNMIRDTDTPIPDLSSVPSELTFEESWDGEAVSELIRSKCSNGETPAFLFLGRKEAGLLQEHLAEAFGEDAVTTLAGTYYKGLDVVTIDGKARGITVRNLITGELERYHGDAVLLCTGGYGNVYYLSTNAKNSNATAAWRCYKKGALFANPCFTQIHPTCIPVSGDYQSKLTLMSESLRNDGRVWVPKKEGDNRAPGQIP